MQRVTVVAVVLVLVWGCASRMEDATKSLSDMTGPGDTGPDIEAPPEECDAKPSPLPDGASLPDGAAEEGPVDVVQDGMATEALGPTPEVAAWSDVNSAGINCEGETPEGPQTLDPAEFAEEYAKVQAEAETLSVSEFKDLYSLTDTPAALDYVPAESGYIDMIDSFLEFTDDEWEKLNANGFVVSHSRQYANPGDAYLDIHFLDLPVFISADSVLHAWHESYDELLKRMEEEALAGWLSELLAAASGELPGYLTEYGNQGAAIRDADLLLTVARSLLAGSQQSSATGGDVDAVASQLVDKANAAGGIEEVEMFGEKVKYDFSQFKPRGHYTESELLKRYFRAMMWLGRTQMVLAEPKDMNSDIMVLKQRHLESAFVLWRTVVDGGAMPLWNNMDAVLRVMVGGADSMDMTSMQKFAASVGMESMADLDSGVEPETLLVTLLCGGFGQQQINSAWLAADLTSPEPVQLPRVFTFLGQRFAVDSYVFGNVVFDKVKFPPRTLPEPADSLFVLGNNAALWLLDGELDTFNYQGQLHLLRFLVDSYAPGFWTRNMYNYWLGGIRALSANSYDDLLPPAMRTEAWLLRTMQAQLASWAQLRHDTILYVKQSYTSGGMTCEYPDGYVEPVPAFYEHMAQLGQDGLDLLNGLPLPSPLDAQAVYYFQHLAAVSTTLADMAHKELNGEEFTPTEVDFFKSIVSLYDIGGCGGPYVLAGWYAALCLAEQQMVGEFQGTIADVHTDPNEPSPIFPDSPQVLHAGTGYTNLVVFTAPTCNGPKAYVGPALSYYKHVMKNSLERLDDEQWEVLLNSTSKPHQPGWTDAFTGK